MKRCALAAAIGWFLFSTVVAGAAELRVLTTADGLPSNWVTALAAAPDGKLWIGTGDAGLYVIDPVTGKGKGYRAADGLSSDAVVSIASFDGKVYVGTAAALSVFDGNAWKTIGKVENVTMRNVRVAASQDGKQLWACSVYLAGGTVRFDGKTWKFMGGEGRGLFNDVQGFAFLPSGVLMASGAGVPYLHTGTEVSPMDKGLPPMNIFAAGSLKGEWLLGTSRGVFRLVDRWEQVPLFVGAGAVFSIAGKDGDAVVGADGGVVRFGARGSASLTVKDGLPASRVMAVAISGDYVAAGTAKGLALIREW